MKTIILCGGTGTRLKEETEFKPKPMVYVGKKPILWHIMQIYAAAGFNEFILALGYKADYIKDFFLNQKAFTTDFTLDTYTHKAKYHFENRRVAEKFKITFVDTGIETMPGERILRCKDYIPEKDREFMVSYGDGVADIDIRKVVTFHRKQKTLGTITGVHPRSRFGMIQIMQHNKIKGFDEKPMMSEWINAGFMVFEKEAFSYFKEGEMEHAALRRLASGNNLSVYKHEGFWYCMDTYKEVADLNELWQQPHPSWKIWE